MRSADDPADIVVIDAQTQQDVTPSYRPIMIEQ